MKLIITTQPDTKTDLNELEGFVEAHPRGNFFQSAKGFRFFYAVDNYSPILITARQGRDIVGSLVAVNIREGGGPKGIFSRRCIIFGGPLIQEENPDAAEILDELLDKLNETTSSIYTEFRNHFDLSAHRPVFEQQGYDYNPHLNFIVRVHDNPEESMKLLNSSKRRQVRKSLRSGAEIREAANMEEVEAFYLILKELYETKVQKPLAPFSFFEQFFRRPDTGKYLLVFYENEVIGGIMCPIYKETIYEWYIAGLDGTIKNVYPSILATWAPIAYASENGLKYFDFMGAGKPDDDYGVREFKSKFGGEEVEFGRYVKINKPMLYKVGKLGLHYLQKYSVKI